MLDTGRAVWNLGEIIFAEFLLLFHAERTMVGRDDLQVIHLQTLPKLGLVPLLTQRRRHYVLCSVEVFAVIVDGKEEILRTGFGEGGNAAIARLAHLIQSISATQVNYVNRRLSHLRDRNCAMHAFSFSESGPGERMILRSGVTFSQGMLNDLVDDDAIL